MATFVGQIAGVGTKRIVETVRDEDTKQRVIVGTHPELRIALSSASCDVSDMEDLIGGMMGKSVKISITLEQGELGL
jgi:hypothetical protein